MKKLSTVFTVGILGLAVQTAANAKDEVIYLYDWAEYIPPGLLEDFTAETGIKVIFSSFESNETMYAKMKTMGDSGGYDVIAPSNYFVSKMRKEGMLMPLDHSKLPSLQELDPEMLDKPYDPGNQYSVPQIFGATAIAYNSDIYPAGTFNSWNDLWKPEFKDKLQLTDDARELFHMTLVTMGEDPNTTNPELIKKAYEKLLTLRPNVLTFNSDNPANSFIAGEVNAGMLWNGSAFIARKEGMPINISWPKEGAIFWMDTLAIPATSKNPEAAHKLINYLISAPVAEKVALEVGYPTPNLLARKKLPKEIVEDSQLYPPLEVMKSSIWQDDVGDVSAVYENYFQQFKAAK